MSNKLKSIQSGGDRNAERDEQEVRDDTVKYVVAGQSGGGKSTLGENLGVLTVGRDELLGLLAEESPEYRKSTFGDGKGPAKGQPGLAFIYGQYTEVTERGAKSGASGEGILADLDYNIFASKPSTKGTDRYIADIKHGVSVGFFNNVIREPGTVKFLVCVDKYREYCNNAVYSVSGIHGIGPCAKPVCIHRGDSRIAEFKQIF